MRPPAQFWAGVGRRMPIGVVTRGEGNAISLSPASKWFANWAGYFSPSQLNPLELNPLRDLIESQIDFERRRSLSPFKLFVVATQASTRDILALLRSEKMSARSAVLTSANREESYDTIILR